MKVPSLMVAALLAFGLLCVANSISAQEEGPPSQFEHIRGLRSFVGFWTAESPNEEDEEPEGGEATFVLDCRWMSNRSYLRMALLRLGEGRQRAIIGTSLIGKDFGKDQVSLWGFWPDAQVHGKVEVGDGTATWTESGVANDGRKSTADGVMKVDGDKLTIDVTNRKIGEEVAPDMHITLTRSQRPGRGRGGP